MEESGDVRQEGEQGRLPTTDEHDGEGGFAGRMVISRIGQKRRSGEIRTGVVGNLIMMNRITAPTRGNLRRTFIGRRIDRNPHGRIYFENSGWARMGIGGRRFPRRYI